MRMRPALRRIVGALVAACAAVPAPADTILWLAGTSGNFGNGANWQGGVAPGAGDIAYFRDFSGGNPPYTVTFLGQTIVQPIKNYTTHDLRVGPNTVTFTDSSTLPFGPSTYTVSSMIGIGETGPPSTLNTSLLRLEGPAASIGMFAGSQGTLNVASGEFRVTGSGPGFELAVGDLGAGTLNVTSGGSVSLTGADGNAVVGSSAGVSGTVNVSGVGSTWSSASNNQAAPTVIGDFGHGVFNISAGAQVSGFGAVIAQQMGSTGAVAVSGQGSTWTNRGELIIGGDAPATLTIAGGGQVSDDSAVVGNGADSTGAVNVSGAGSKWTHTSDLRLGSNFSFNGATAPGVLNVSAGGEVDVGGDAQIGASGVGTLTVDGPGSRWNVGGRITVDESSSAAFTAGADAATAEAIDNGVVNVSGADWNISNFLFVGVSGPLVATSPSVLHIDGGGHVTNRVAFLGSSRSGSGQVTVNGPGSAWTTTEEMFIGLEGQGQFLVAGGAHATTALTQLGVSFALGEASVSGAGSNWSNTGDLIVGVAGSGDVAVSKDGVLTVGGLLSVGPLGTLEGNSHIVGDVRNGGTVSPGLTTSFVPADIIGALHLDGSYLQTSAGDLQIQLQSLTTFDQMLVGDHASLGGRLDLALAFSFTPMPGQSFTVLTAAAGVSGAFTAVEQPTTMPMGLLFDVIYHPTSVELRVVHAPIFSADFNQDGDVDGPDLLVWKASHGINSGGDADGDGDADGADFLQWQQQLGAVPSLPATAAVPEPSEIGLMLWISGVVGLRWRHGS